MTRRPRILHVIPKLSYGGAERLLVDIAKAFAAKNFELAVVSFSPKTGTRLEEELKEKRIKIYYLNKRKGLDLSVIPKLFKVLRTFRPDVIHTHLSVLHYTLIPSLLCRIPVKVHTIHNIAQKDATLIGRFIQWIAFHLGKVVPVSVSEEVAKTVIKLYGKSIYNPIIYNGISTSKFSKSIKNYDEVKKEKIILINIARIAPQKNHMLLLESFLNAIKVYPNMELWLVGDGPLRQTIKKAIMERGLQDKIFILGMREDVPNLLEKADIFIMSSNYEGLPLSLLEAMAAGKAVIATSVGGITEVIKHGVTGILVPPQNLEAMTNAILQLANDPEYLKNLGKAAQKIVRERFDISNTVKEYESLYQTLLQKYSKKTFRIYIK